MFRHLLATFSTVICVAFVACADYHANAAERPAATAERLPNVVIVFTDDQGYADVGCYGAEGFDTPHLDRMAAEGRRFTNFYVAQAVCSASRAALLTGCYPNRVGIRGALGPGSRIGIHADELLLSEVFKQRDYATAIYGKWHLGHHKPFLPTNNGFDEYFGLPYSNDMWPHHPTADFPPLPLIEGDETKKIVDWDDMHQLTTWYAEHAVSFIERNRDRPFFLYLAHNMPHVPLGVSDKFQGKSQQGMYGDVIEEIDWSVGQVLDALERTGNEENTLVIFTCDNGPWLSYGNHAGSAKPLREGKGTTFEGGVREPCIMRWPGKIPPGTVCDELSATIDILPTMAYLIGVDLPTDRVIDGKNIWPLMAGETAAKTPHDVYYYYWGNELQAIRSGNWKLHFPHRYRSMELGGTPGKDGQPGQYVQREIGLALFDLDRDIGERNNVADEHPEVVERLKALADEARADLGDSANGEKGDNVRQPGRWTPADSQ